MVTRVGTFIHPIIDGLTRFGSSTNFADRRLNWRGL
jgi:hypothetical protein